MLSLFSLDGVRELSCQIMHMQMGVRVCRVVDHNRGCQNDFEAEYFKAMYNKHDVERVGPARQTHQPNT